MDQDVGLNFTMVEDPAPRGVRRVRIKVVGVGGAGGNAVNRMIRAGLSGVEFVAVNTDFQDLEKSLAPTRVAIGQKLTQGLGTGGFPERGEKAAIEDTDLLVEHLQGADLIFITAGMGGGTGTGAAPVLARLAQESGALTVAVVTRPFSMEGRVREKNALYGLDQLREAAATLIVIPNDNLLLNLPEDVSDDEAFEAADDVLRQGVQGITDLITRPGKINLDFEDARTVLSAGGRAVMGMGQALGADRAVAAASKAANNPLLEDASIQGARAILINFTGGNRIALKEMKEACDLVREKAHPEANLLFGTSTDASLGDELRVTVVAAAFDDAEVKTARKPMLAAVQSASAQVAEAPSANTFGTVPGVDSALPASAPSGFLRGFGKRGLFVNPNETPITPGSPMERDYEEYQTPTFIRKSRE
ncbi:MAG: cell division protein FtsZ [Acidobacteriota bacterium]